MSNDIQVVILAGGLGTRLREQTEFIPKPMVPIGTKPILWHIMKFYAHYGYRRFIICLGYKGETIKEYFWNYREKNSDFTIRLADRNISFHSSHSEDWEVTLADTGLHAMTGARIKKIEQYIDQDNFLLTYGDGVSNVDLKALAEFHRGHGRAATVTGVKPPSRFGELIVHDDAVIEFSEKPQVASGLINGGFFAFSREIFRYLTHDNSCVLEREPLERLATDRQLMIFRHGGFWQCMDTLRDMNLLNEYWDKGNPPWKIWND